MIDPLLFIIQKLHPNYFGTTQYEKVERKSYRYEDLLHTEIIHKPPIKNIDAHYFARSHYRDKFFHFKSPKIKEWQVVNDEKKYIDSPPIKIVKRDIIKKDPYDIRAAMERFFKADVLIVKEINFRYLTREEILHMIGTNDFRIFYVDQLPTIPHFK